MVVSTNMTVKFTDMMASKKNGCNQNFRTKNTYIIEKYWNFEIGIQIHISVTISEFTYFSTL